MTKRKNEWVTYPEVELTIDDLKKHFNMLENEILDPINELEVEESIIEGINETPSEDDLNKKNYVKITPTFYIQSVESEKIGEDGEIIELFKILNPETNVVETREITESEKKEILAHQLKESQVRFKSIQHKGRLTINKFGAGYKKNRQRKNRQANASRKANRK